MRFRGPALNLMLLTASLLGSVWVADAWLGWREARDPHTEWERIEAELMARNRAVAERNPYGFTDRARQQRKPVGVYRIAVLGDSFVWGDGLPYEETWSHKLERMLVASYRDLEVMHWGRNGWSTQDQYAFLVQEGVRYAPDLLIVGLVSNDPDVGRIPLANRGARRRIAGMVSVRALFPHFGKALEAGLQRVVYGKRRGYYLAWLNQLYTDENLAVYHEVLQQLASTCAAHGIELLVVQTPGELWERVEKRYRKLEPLIASAGIRYLRLFALAEKQLGELPPEVLRASPVNGHPGPIFTQFFADEVFGHLRETPPFAGELQRRARVFSPL